MEVPRMHSGVLRCNCALLRKEAGAISACLLNTEAELSRLSEANSKLRERDKYHLDQQHKLSLQAEELQKCLSLKEHEQQESLLASQRDIQSLIMTQTKHCETLEKFHAEELQKYKDENQRLHQSVPHRAYSGDTDNHLELKVEKLLKELALKENELRSMSSAQQSRCNQTHLEQSESCTAHANTLRPAWQKIYPWCHKALSEVLRQRQALHFTLNQLGVSYVGRLQEISTQRALCKSGVSLEGLEMICQTLPEELDLLRNEMAETLICTLKRREDRDEEIIAHEILRNQERDVFRTRLKDLEQDMLDRQDEWSKERLQLQVHILDLEAALQKGQVVHEHRDVGVQSVIPSFPNASNFRSMISTSSQSDIQLEHFRNLEMYLDDMREHILVLEKEKASWETFAIQP